MKTSFFILLVASSLLVSGCSQLESFRTNVQQGASSAAKEAQKQVENTKTSILETKQDIDRKIQKVQNVVNAVDDLKKEL
ncbi:hypothetical protein KAZ92_00785 [Candidatus Gracilibacteria bacterium]|nr:hypothetical protein [Candidatus Gracilibacteria bacterium]